MSSIRENFYAVGFKSHIGECIYLELLHVTPDGPVHTKIKEIGTVNAAVPFNNDSLMISGQSTELASLDLPKLRHRFRFDHGYKSSDVTMID